MSNQKISAYKSLELGKEEVAKVTEEELQGEINKLVTQQTKLEPKERKSVNGDTVNIDFEGFVDGVAFDGGKAEKFDLELGSNTFIPGFEDQLVGLVKGDEKDVVVKFPENYQAENLKGKEATFKCKVNEVKVKKEAQFNDELAKSLGLNNVDELKENINKNLLLQHEQHANNAYLSKVCNHIAENSDIDIEEKDTDARVENIIEYYKQNMAQYGSTLDQFLEMSGKTLDEFKKELRQEAVNSLKVDRIFDYIRDEEGLTATEKEIDDECKAIQAHYHITDEQLAKFKEERSEDIKAEIARQKICEFLIKNNK